MASAPQHLPTDGGHATTAAGNRAGLDAVLALPESRLVVPNRGLWICH